MKLGALIKWGDLIKDNVLEKGGQRSFCSKTFYNGYKNLIESPKKSEIN
jgi:hypothetical protein